MPRLHSALPRYRKHRATGQAIVNLSGQDFYLGPHGTKSSKLQYDKLIAEWLVRGRRPITGRHGAADEISVVELIAAYKQHAEVYYRKDGVVTNEVKMILAAAKVLRLLYGRELVGDIDPLKLEAVRESMIRLGWCRKQINKQVGRIVRMFRWGAQKRLVGGDVVNALRELDGLKEGRSTARESIPVKPIDDSIVNATLEYLPRIVTDMVRLQRLCACRPEEICQLRPCDVDTSGEVWSYRPATHKTQHHNKDRVIFFGPKSQEVLRPHLLRDETHYCFCPSEGERKRRAAAHDRRVTPSGQGNEPGTNRKSSPQRKAGECYTPDSYRRAIHRACEMAGVEKWSPNRLRHSAATAIRKQFGLEASQVVMGHAGANVTQIYAVRDQAKAAEVMSKVG